MQIINLSAVLGLLATTAYAADCSGWPDNRISQWEDLYWDVRQKVCANTQCTYQQPCSVSNAKNIGGEKVTVTLSRKKSGSGGFPDCWAATDNIIQQCIRGSKQASGSWSASNQQYNFDVLYTAF